MQCSLSLSLSLSLSSLSLSLSLSPSLFSHFFPWRADGHHSAGVGIAGIRLLDALLVATLVSVAALIIGLALWPAASDSVRLGNESDKAVAYGLLTVVDLATGARTAGRRVTGIGPLNTPEVKIM
jgi:hypothetical protein